MAVMFAQKTVVHSWNHVPAEKRCRSVCSKIYFTYGAVQIKRTDFIEIGRHLGPVMEEPLALHFCSLDPYINC